MHKISLGALSALLQGTLTHPDRAEEVVSNVRALDQAGPGDLAFLWDPNYAHAAASSKASAVIAAQAIDDVPTVVVPDPQAAMLTLLGQVYSLQHPQPPAGVHPKAAVDPSAQLGEGVSVGPCAVVEAGAVIGDGTHVHAHAYVGPGVQVGRECQLHPQSVVLNHCVLKDRVTLWSGAIIGKDGFGFLQRDGAHVRIPQIGRVILEDDVEVGAMSTVARGALEDTVVGKGSKIDDHCHVAHNCQLGQNVLLIGYARLGGSVTIHDDAILLQDSAVGVGHTVGKGAILGSGAKALYKDVGPGEQVLGWPAQPHLLAKRIQASLPKLPELRRRLASLERKVDKLATED